MEKQSNGTGDRASRFEHPETLVNIEHFWFRMFVHPAFLCTNVRFGLHFVDHVYLMLPKDSGYEIQGAGISSGFSNHYVRATGVLYFWRFSLQQ